jgi:iron(III) transport system ATP-binding protein
MAPMSYGIYLYFQSVLDAVPARLARHRRVRWSPSAPISHRLVAANSPHQSREPPMNPVGVDIRNVALSFGRTKVLRDINLAIAPGEFFALLGPSGSGKSTLLRLIAGFNRNESGQVLIGGRDVSAVPPWQRDVGMVFQSYALWPHMTVAENVAFGLEERRLPRAEIRRRCRRAGTGGTHRAGDARPASLGGQQQRVAIAHVAIEPAALLLDEPLSNLGRCCGCKPAGTEETAGAAQHHHAVRHPRPGRGDDHLRPDRRAGPGRDPAGRHAHGTVRPPGEPLSQFVGSVNLPAGSFTRAGSRLHFRRARRVALPPALSRPAPLARSFRPHAVAVSPPATRLRWTANPCRHDCGEEFLGEFLRYEVLVGQRARRRRPRARAAKRRSTARP